MTPPRATANLTTTPSQTGNGSHKATASDRRRRSDRRQKATAAISSPVRFKIGAQAPDGNQIEALYGQTETVLVFRTPKDTVGYFIDIDEVTSTMAAALVEFERLRGLVFRIYPKQNWKDIQDELGSSLFNSLTAIDEPKAIASFAGLNDRTLRRAATDARLAYTVAATSAVSIATLLGWIFYAFYPEPEVRIYGACGTFAALGAFASVILGLQKLTIDPLEKKQNMQAFGAFRIVVGILFAVFLIAAAKASLIAGFAVTTTASLLAYSFACGFSERLAPDLLTSLEKTTT